MRIPMQSLTAPLVATSHSVQACAQVEMSCFVDVVASLPQESRDPRKRSKLAHMFTGAATQDTLPDSASHASAPQSRAPFDLAAFQTAVEAMMHEAESHKAPRDVLACMGWKHGESEGRPVRSVALVLAAVRDVLAQEAVQSRHCAVLEAVWRMLLEESLPVLEALQSWSPLPLHSDAARSTEAEGTATEAAQLLPALQVSQHACFFKCLHRSASVTLPTCRIHVFAKSIHSR